MNKNQSVSSAQCRTRTATAWKVVAALVVLRLCVGWHFFSEGVKKFSYDVGRGEWKIAAPVESFFRAAKGPLAPRLQRQLPGSYHWQSLLAVPRETTPEAREQLKNWVREYVARRRTELQKNKLTEVSIPDFVPYANWAAAIEDDWRALHQRFASLPILTDEQRERSAVLFEKHHCFLADMLAGESLDIQSYQHELWRQAKARTRPGADEIPFEQERLAKAEAETARTPLKWASAVQSARGQLVGDLRSLLTDQQRTSSAVDRALADPRSRRLAWMSVVVSCLVLGIGLCLLMGLFTRVASIAGALFLCSVMITQPPWVAEADSRFFSYQLVELAAFLLLAAASAGRWWGLDFLLQSFWAHCCGGKANKR